jgi:hypothetical protein
MQMAFNLLLTTNGRAVITKSEKELNFKVTLVWRSEWNGEGGGNL